MPGVIHTIAGGGPDGTTASSVFLDWPSAVAVDAAGDVYIAAAQLNQILKLDPSGQVTVIAGTGIAAYAGDGGPARRAALDLSSAYLGAVSSLALDAAGNIYVTDVVNNVIRRVDRATGIITTVAGNGTAGYTGDGGPAASAELNQPMGLALDNAGDLYIADINNEVIRRVDALTGDIATVAGNGTAGYSGDGGPALNASFNLGAGLALDSAGDLYIADTYNNAVRRLSPDGTVTTLPCSGNLDQPSAVLADDAGHLYIGDAFAVQKLDLQTGNLTAVAGQEGLSGYAGDGGPATAAALDLSGVYYPVAGSLALDSAGDLFIPDTYNNRIREVNATGNIETVAGGGTGGDGGPARRAVLGFDVSMALDAQGNILFGGDDGRVRRFSPDGGAITTVAGNGRSDVAPPTQGGGSALTATLADANYITTDNDGNLLISDGFDARIWRVDSVTGIISLVAGKYRTNYTTCAPGTLGDGGPAVDACLAWPRGVAVDAAGDIYIADSSNYRIRKVDAVTGTISTIAGNGTKTCSGDGGPALDAGLGAAGGGVPLGIALDANGNIYFGDCFDVRRIDGVSGNITTVAGNGTNVFDVESGPATAVSLGSIRGLAVDALGNLFIADPFYNRIRRLDAYTGVLSTIAGTGPATIGTGGFSGNGGLATDAQLNVPYGLALDGDGHLYIGDSGNFRVREITLPPFAGMLPAALDFGTQAAGTRTVQTVTVKNTGTRRLWLGWPNIRGNQGDVFRIEGSTCYFELNSGDTCTVTVAFRPHRAGTASATLELPSDAAFSPQSVPLAGTATGGHH